MMKILVLEDDPSKKGHLLSYLNENAAVVEEIDTAICTEQACRLLKEKSYDLFVVDIVVPKNLGGEKSERNSIELVEMIDDEVEGIKRPTHILPVSSCASLSSTAQDFFKPRPWGILPYNEADTSSLESIKRIIEYLGRQSTPILRSADVVIITALAEPEFQAIEALPFDWGAYEPLDNMHLYKRGLFNNATSGRAHQVVAVFCLRMGPVQASILTTKSISAFSPKLVIMAGICAGMPKKTEIGDVVAADVSWDWQSGKFVDAHGVEGFQIAPHHLDIHESLRTPLFRLKKDSEHWKSFAEHAVEVRVGIPKLVVGPMATGSSVLADERVSERIKEQQHKNLVGLDMETYGVYAAVQACAPQTPVLSFKSVCDKGDLQKNDEYQAYASLVSARTVERFLTLYADTIL